jgi:sugar/nucleoside kinase (ribokinase family)
MSASRIVVVGSLAFDNIETPRAKVDLAVGGAASYFAVAASFFAPVAVVGVVGRDFPQAELDFFKARGIDLEGLEIADGQTFRWTGRYHENMNLRDTLDLQLNVFANFSPKLPAAYRTADICFLANIDPALQLKVLSELERPRLVAADTMNHWIENAHDNLVKLLKRVEILVINDQEAFQLSGSDNIIRASRRILEMGPRHVIIKRGEYGAIHFSADSVFAVPAYPLEEVVDPTGAGDTFAGGLIGYLAKQPEVTTAAVRKGMVYGSVMASMVVEDFSFDRLRKIDESDIEKRYNQFVALTQF